MATTTKLSDEELFALYQTEVAEVTERSTGNSLPMGDILAAVDYVFKVVKEKTGKDEVPVRVLKGLVIKTLQAEYESWPQSNKEMEIVVGRDVRVMPVKEARALRLEQLERMSGSKGDNIARRLYGLCNNSSYKRFTAAGKGILKRIQ